MQFFFFNFNFRVFPDVTLKSLRRELGSLLGADKSINKFSFLKCVGRSLALVSTVRVCVCVHVFEQNFFF